MPFSHRLTKPLTLFCWLIAAPILLSGCSQKFNDVNDTMQLALFGNADATLSAERISHLPYASIYATVDNGPQAFMVLALAEPTATFGNNQTKPNNITPPTLKWLSSDNGMLITQAGRLIKTLNLPLGNLLSVSSAQVDPLINGLHLPNTARTWTRTIDWQPGYHAGYRVTSHFEQHPNQIIMINQQPKETLYFTELVAVEALDVTFVNAFWLDPTTGNVIKSHQKLAPSLPYVDITVLKPYL
ncbi:YjbF family lipoprotein [Photobacterium nomapromontoriensis]|uniref:YjbF family lipoprotein n=1 Tax=Photobacterium nomapromontoriensis TaxID=2910237 RepID=UPI003D10B5B2